MYIAALSTIALAAIAALVYVLLRFERTPIEAAPQQQNARDLMPGYCDADPSDPTAGNVRLAFRAHCLWQNDCNVVVLSWPHMLSLKLDTATLFTQLCELYSRAIFECAFCLHFDGASPNSDAAVLRQIGDSYGNELAFKVHTMVATRGIVLRRFTQSEPARRGAPVAD